jgi:2-oxo-4-hydroxy-4-carboxy--5-ureidoimidazoline (OHCU) decarboxylase
MGASTHHIAAALAPRRSATREVELAEALRQVARIAWFRLEDVIRS